MFQGIITAIVTPFVDGRIDTEALNTLIERQLEASVDGLVVTATTGECATLTGEEHEYVVELCINATRRRVPVFVGCGSPSTQHARALVRHAQDSGADGILAVTPYYNRPSQEGLVRHFSEVSQATTLPVILYNVPARTGVDLSNDTVAQLAELPGIVGIKDATGDLSRLAWMRDHLPSDFLLLSGDDTTAFAYLASGGHGVISVTSNVEPRRMAKVVHLLGHGNLAEARQWHQPLTRLHTALFSDSSPSPTKYALSVRGLCRDDVRLPLLPANASARTAVDEALLCLATAPSD